MRAMLCGSTLLFVGAICFAPVRTNAQINFDGLAFSICKKIGADTARLKCFDEIGAKQDQPNGEMQTPSIPAKWNIQTDQSPIDDSPQVAASMAGTNGSLLLIRCKEHKTEVAFAPGGFFIKGSNAFIPTIVRLNEDQPINANWIPSNNGSAAFVPQAVDFIRSLPDGGKLFIRITGFEGRTSEGKFDLADVSEVRSKVRDACNWSTPKSDKQTDGYSKPARDSLKKLIDGKPASH